MLTSLQKWQGFHKKCQSSSITNKTRENFVLSQFFYLLALDYLWIFFFSDFCQTHFFFILKLFQILKWVLFIWFIDMFTYTLNFLLKKPNIIPTFWDLAMTKILSCDYTTFIYKFLFRSFSKSLVVFLFSVIMYDSFNSFVASLITNIMIAIFLLTLWLL